VGQTFNACQAYCAGLESAQRRTILVRCSKTDDHSPCKTCLVLFCLACCAMSITLMAAKRIVVLRGAL